MLLYKKHKGVDDVKHLRKTVSILALSAALLCVLCSVAFAASNNDSAFAVSESGAAGDIINVDVYLSGKDIGSVYIDLEYDDTALEFVSARTFVAGLRFNYNSSTVLSGGNIVRFTGSVDSYDALNVNGAVMRVELKILNPMCARKLKYPVSHTVPTVHQEAVCHTAGLLMFITMIAKRCFAKIQKPPETYIPHTKISPTQ